MQIFYILYFYILFPIYVIFISYISFHFIVVNILHIYKDINANILYFIFLYFISYLCNIYFIHFI